MATIPQARPKRRTLNESAKELHRLLEECFDDMGLTQAERDARYSALDRSLDAKDASRAKA
jgi:hypothetical protein